MGFSKLQHDRHRSGQGIIVLAFDSRGREGWWWTSSYYENDIKESARPLSTRGFEWKAEPGACGIFLLVVACAIDFANRGPVDELAV